MKIKSQNLLLLTQTLMLWVTFIFLGACNNSRSNNKPAQIDSNSDAIKSNGSTSSSKTDSLSVFENFIPSGWMGDGEDPGRRWLNLDESWRTKAHSSPTCTKFFYNPGGPNGWAGIYWQNKPNNWCKSPGEDFSKKGFTKIIFWAKGEIGGELVEFKAGGIKVCAAGGNYHDSFETKAKRITLDTTWTQYTIDLSGKDLKSVIGGFCWSAPAPASPMTFYIDDVYYR